MSKKLSDFNNGVVKYEELEDQYDSLEEDLQKLATEYATFKKFAKDELRYAVSKTAEKLDRFAPSRELAWVKRTVFDIIDDSLCALHHHK